MSAKFEYAAAFQICLQPKKRAKDFNFPLFLQLFTNFTLAFDPFCGYFSKKKNLQKKRAIFELICIPGLWLRYVKRPDFTNTASLESV